MPSPVYMENSPQRSDNGSNGSGGVSKRQPNRDETEMMNLTKEQEKDSRNWETDASDSSKDASSEHDDVHGSCWKRDRRIQPVCHIPRLKHEASEPLKRALTQKKEIKELIFPDPDVACKTHCKGYLAYFVPIFDWFPKYMAGTMVPGETRGSMLRSDCIAGLTVGVMAIPQTMSYANIAGLPYVYGLYSVMIATLVYGFVGNSRQLGVGPVAMVSLIVEAGLQGLLTESECPGAYGDANPEGLAQYEICPDPYVNLAFLVSFWVGIFNLVAGLLNLGFLVNFLAHPVVSGFTSGAAIIIGLSQAKYIFGFNIEKSPYVYITISEIFQNIGDTKPVVFVLGTVWIFSLIGISYVGKNFAKFSWLRPLGPLIMCVIGILLCYGIPALKEDHDVSIVGDIPDGFPPFSLGDLDLSRTGDVMSVAITASLIGYMESIAISKALANKNDYKINANGEMVALGLINFIGSMFSCYPTTGSFSRSAVNDATGAKSQFAGLITAGVILLTLVALTELFYYLPKFCLAAIVIASVKNLIAWREAIHLYHMKKSDFVLWVFAFIGTLFLGIELGIGLAVVVSLIIIIHETVRPQISVLWRLPHTHVYASIKTTTHGSFVPGVLVVRIGNSVYFANSGYIEDMLYQYMEQYSECVEEYSQHEKLHYIVISLSSCTSVDSQGAETLQKLVKDFAKKGVKVCFASIGNRVWPVIDKSGLVKDVGLEWFHETCHDAVQHCLAHDNSHIDGDKHHAENIETNNAPLTVGPLAQQNSLVEQKLSTYDDKVESGGMENANQV